MLKIHKLDIPRTACAMSVIQALLIHSSCVYTGEIALNSAQNSLIKRTPKSFLLTMP